MGILDWFRPSGDVPKEAPRQALSPIPTEKLAEAILGIAWANGSARRDAVAAILGGVTLDSRSPQVLRLELITFTIMSPLSITLKHYGHFSRLVDDLEPAALRLFVKFARAGLVESGLPVSAHYANAVIVPALIEYESAIIGKTFEEGAMAVGDVAARRFSGREDPGLGMSLGMLFVEIWTGLLDPFANLESVLEQRGGSVLNDPALFRTLGHQRRGRG